MIAHGHSLKISVKIENKALVYYYTTNNMPDINFN